MRRCDVLLVIHGTDKICEEYIPSKVYEYLLTSRPVLGLGLPGSELDVLLTTNGHIFVNGEIIYEVKTAIRRFLERWETRGLADHKSESLFTVNEYVEGLLKIADKIALSSYGQNNQTFKY